MTMHIHIFTWQGQRDGTNELAGFQPGAQVTTDRLIKDLPNYDAVFHIGDLSYANGFLAQWDQFTAQIEPIASRVPYMVARLFDRSILMRINLRSPH